jgi:isoamylase
MSERETRAQLESNHLTDHKRTSSRIQAEKLECGMQAPLGATWIEEYPGYNFALYSRNATGVTLLLYESGDPYHPAYTYRFNYLRNKTGRVWHCWVDSKQAAGACYYAYRVEGPSDPDHGHRFDPEKILLDPFAREVYFPPDYSREACCRPGPNDGKAPLGVLPVHEEAFSWETPEATTPGEHDAVIYELHVKGFTARENSEVSEEVQGTFLGVIEKIPYLKELGVNAVELLPIQQFDPQEGNYWGYMTLHFFTPHQDYGCTDPRQEFRQMVQQLHRAGIKVILDVVYNHTSEGGENGPTYSLRGIDNLSYYLLEQNRRLYKDDSGCGNTLRCGHMAVRSLILSSLRFWVREMHVDGFRFDLASILTRSSDGSTSRDPVLIGEISMLASDWVCDLIAEAWDISSYQLGRGFPGLTWSQWNGRFRDDVRSFVKGDSGMVTAMMQRLYGSDDLFPDTLVDTCHPFQSVNFITAHDGFSLYDLVSFNQKHNQANGHQNTDGMDWNLSWNCGWEGDKGAQPEVLALRRQQVKNFCALLMLSNGTPMFLAGDEFMNTQGGNNNPYNQDNETTWLDWNLLDRNRDVFRFFCKMIAFRKSHHSIHRPRFWREDVRWFGTIGSPDFVPDSHSFAYFLSGASVGDDDLYVMINADWQDKEFRIQEGRAESWFRVVDTSLLSPQDILDPGEEPSLNSDQYLVRARSVVVLRRPLAIPANI